MIKQTVSKELKWEAAHRLVQGYKGKCAHVHGHSWVAVVTIGLRTTLLLGLNKYGFVKDYGDFKALKNWIDNNWDHASLYSTDDFKWKRWLETNKQRRYRFCQNPTSERIAEVLFNTASELLNDERCEVVEVRIKETCTSEAIHRKE